MQDLDTPPPKLFLFLLGSPFFDPKGKRIPSLKKGFLLSGAMLFRDMVLQPGPCLAGGSGANKAKWSEGY